MARHPTDESELLELCRRLLRAIDAGDWDDYTALCDPTLSAFEPEAVGHLVEGMDFHRFYFDGDRPQSGQQSTIASPHVRLLGDVAVVCYARLVQRRDAAGVPVTIGYEETRIWQRGADGWRHLHFHRSRIGRWPD